MYHDILTTQVNIRQLKGTFDTYFAMPVALLFPSFFGVGGRLTVSPALLCTMDEVGPLSRTGSGGH